MIKDANEQATESEVYKGLMHRSFCPHRVRLCHQHRDASVTLEALRTLQFRGSGGGINRHYGLVDQSLVSASSVLFQRIGMS